MPILRKAVIIGGLTHPDRQTNLISTEPQLYGEYNGIATVINPDGSASLTFNGATDNNGEVIDSSQGTTKSKSQLMVLFLFKTLAEP